MAGKYYLIVKIKNKQKILKNPHLLYSFIFSFFFSIIIKTDKGFVGTILREVPGTAAWFGMYEMSLSILCPNQKEEDPKSWQVIAAGGVGGMGYWGAFYPADTVKTEMQTITTTMSNIKQPSFIETFRTIYKTRGMNGLYAGLGPTLLRAIPANAAVFYVYDVVSKAMLGGKKK